MCKRAYNFLSQFKYIKITDENASFISNPNLTDFMVQRSKMNEYFELLNERCFEEHVSEVEEYKNLITPTCYITNEQLMLLNCGKLVKAVNLANDILVTHLKTCIL